MNLAIPSHWRSRWVADESPPGWEVQCPRCGEWLRCTDDWFYSTVRNGTPTPKAPCKGCQSEYSAASQRKRMQRRRQEHAA